MQPTPSPEESSSKGRIQSSDASSERIEAILLRPGHRPCGENLDRLLPPRCLSGDLFKFVSTPGRIDSNALRPVPLGREADSRQVTDAACHFCSADWVEQSWLFLIRLIDREPFLEFVSESGTARRKRLLRKSSVRMRRRRRIDHQPTFSKKPSS